MPSGFCTRHGTNCDSKKARASRSFGAGPDARSHTARHASRFRSVAHPATNAGHTSAMRSFCQPGRSANAAGASVGAFFASGPPGHTGQAGQGEGAGHAAAGAGAAITGDGVPAAGAVDGAGGVAHAAARSARQAIIGRIESERRRGRGMGDGLWIIILEMVLVLVLAGFIVWWTMGGRRKDDDKRK